MRQESKILTAPDLVVMVAGVYAAEPQAEADLYSLVVRVSSRILGRAVCYEDVIDVQHDIYMAVFQRIKAGGIRAPEAIIGFISVVTNRAVCQYIEVRVKSRKVRSFDDRILGDTINPADTAASPESCAIHDQTWEIVHQTLSEIRECEREILTRYYLQEQSVAEICSEMEITETRFRLLKSRAKAKFGKLGASRVNARAISPRAELQQLMNMELPKAA